MIKLATVFSGIGSIEFALLKEKIKHEIIFACDNGERYIDLNEDEIKKSFHGKNNDEINALIKLHYNKLGKANNVKKTYFANYEISENQWYEDVRFINGKPFEGKVDLFVGGSPCQSFSISGYRLGLEDARGTLFYDYARLISEIKPKVFIYENVPGILSHDNGKTFEIITGIFDSLGYNWSFKKLVAKDFGIPQNRSRIYVVGIRKDLKVKAFKFPTEKKLEKEVKDFLEKTQISQKYFYGEKGFKWVTDEKNLKKRVSINSKISRTQTANQQFNWCGDMILYPVEEQEWAESDPRVHVGEYLGKKSVCRKLTPRECLRLMGYDDSFKIVVDDNSIYRQSGNSIVVNVIAEIMKNIFETGVFNND